MKKLGWLLLAVSLSMPCALRAQDQKSPDLQQQKHPENNPPAEANQPNPAGQTSTGQTDTASKSKSKKRGKKKHDARQAHGTPEPAPEPAPK